MPPPHPYPSVLSASASTLARSKNFFFFPFHDLLNCRRCISLNPTKFKAFMRFAFARSCPSEHHSFFFFRPCLSGSIGRSLLVCCRSHSTRYCFAAPVLIRQARHEAIGLQSSSEEEAPPRILPRFFPAPKLECSEHVSTFIGLEMLPLDVTNLLIWRRQQQRKS